MATLNIILMSIKQKFYYYKNEMLSILKWTKPMPIIISDDILMGNKTL